MVKALFDTNILIDFLNGIDAAREELARYDDPAISIITWMEVMVVASDATSAPTRAVLSRYPVIALDEAIALRSVELRRAHRLELPDAIVWASAITQGRLLITRNEKDFPADDPGVRIPYRV